MKLDNYTSFLTKKGGGNMDISLLASKENLVLIDDCIEKAQKKLPEVFNAGEFIRKYHRVGQKNFSTRCSTISALKVGKVVVDNISKKKKSRVKFFGEHISESVHIIKKYFTK